MAWLEATFGILWNTFIWSLTREQTQRSISLIKNTMDKIFHLLLLGYTKRNLHFTTGAHACMLTSTLNNYLPRKRGKKIFWAHCITATISLVADHVTMPMMTKQNTLILQHLYVITAYLELGIYLVLYVMRKFYEYENLCVY